MFNCVPVHRQIGSVVSFPTSDQESRRNYPAILKGSSSFSDNGFTSFLGGYLHAYPCLTRTMNFLSTGALLLIIPGDSFHPVISKAFSSSFRLAGFHTQQTERTHIDRV